MIFISDVFASPILQLRVKEDFLSRVADMCSKVIQPAARRHSVKSSQPTVNNFAATKFATGDKSMPGRIAPRRKRSSVAQPVRLKLRTPPGVAARLKTSERTSPREGP